MPSPCFAYRPFGVPLAWTETIRDGVGGVDGLNMAFALTVDPASDRLYVVSSGDSALASIAIPPLRFVGDEVDGQGGVDGLDAARGVAVSPDGRHVVASGAFDDALSVFTRERSAGLLAFDEEKRDGIAGVDGLNGVEGVVVSPDGRSVYASGVVDDAVAAFTRDPVTGALGFVEVERDAVNGVNGLDGTSSVAVSPDGKHVYATGYVDDGLAAFARDAATSALSFLEVETQAAGGVSGLDGPSEVVVSPDGKHVYVASEVSDSIAVFARDATTGLLSFVEAEANGVAGVSGLDGARTLALSPDGAYLYAAGFVDSAIADLRARRGDRRAGLRSGRGGRCGRVRRSRRRRLAPRSQRRTARLRDRALRGRDRRLRARPGDRSARVPRRDPRGVRCGQSGQRNAHRGQPERTTLLRGERDRRRDRDLRARARERRLRAGRAAGARRARSPPWPRYARLRRRATAESAASAVTGNSKL